MIRGSLTLIWCLLCQILFSQNVTTRLFSLADGLPDNYVYAIVQDEQDFLWIASGKGLCRFDGQVFVNYPLEQSEENTLVYTGLLDRNNDLWFGTFDGKLYKLDRQHNKLTLYPKRIQGSVSKIVSSHSAARLYILSKGNGVYVLENNRLEKIRYSDNYEITDLLETDAQHVLVSSTEGLLLMNVADGSIQPIPRFGFSSEQIQRSGLGKGYYLVSAERGLFYFELRDTTAIVQQHLAATDLPAYKHIYIDETLQELYLSGSDGTFSIYNYRRKQLRNLAAEQFQANAACLYMDRENTLWVGTVGSGLYAMYRSEFEWMPLHQPVYCMVQDTDKTTYYGTAEGVLVYSAMGALLHKISSLNNQSLGKINALHLDEQKRLWIGSAENGLWVCNKKTYVTETIPFTNTRPIGINAIRASAPDGEIQVCTNLSGVFTYQRGKLLRQLSVADGLLHNNVYDALKTQSGSIYYAMHNTGFNVWKEGKVYEIEVTDRRLSTDFNCFAEDQKGNLFIGSNGAGICVLSNNHVKAFDYNQAFESRYAKVLLFDKTQNLWAIVGSDLYKYYPTQNVLKKISLGLQQRKAPELYNLYQNADGDLFVCTDNGVVLTRASEGAKHSTAPARSYLMGLRVNDSLVALDKPLELKNGKYKLTFSFSALALKNSAQVRFRYMLEGRDAGWSEPGRHQEVEFANLSEGEYVFKVKAYNAEGFEETQACTYRFVILPPFWKSYWFWILVVMLLVFLVLVIIRVRTASLSRAKQKLEQVVEEKTRELREEKRLVEETKRVIEDQNHEIKDSILYARRIQDAILPDKKIITDRADRIFVFYQPRDIVSGDFYWLGEINGIKIVVAADCTGHGVPGAFMSMIGNTLLNKIVIERKISKASDILTELDKEVRRALKQYSQEATKDGMDVALCCVDDAQQTLTYCGALRPLIQIRENLLTVHAPNKHSIGGFNYGSTRQFDQTVIPFQKNDMFYIFSDGYPDQFGGAQGKKFMMKNFKELLVTISSHDLQLQETMIRAAYDKWKGLHDQVDDVLVIGLKM